MRHWAIGRRAFASDFRRVYEGALLHCISRLLQAIYRESKVARLSRDVRGRWRLDIGERPVLHVPVSGPLPFRRLETIGTPWLIRSGRRRRLRTVAGFLAELKRCLARSEYRAVFSELSSDFENSVANVVLNRLLGRSLSEKASAIEPAYQGHQYYPFPALRIGPSLSQVLECCHLCERAVDLPLLEIDGCRIVSTEYHSHEACLRACLGMQLESGSVRLLPVHPWQLSLSPLVAKMLECRLASLSPRRIAAVPLASQRTCRVVGTGFDLKLPVNATLTGEHRLLYQLNCENAPIVSALAMRLRHAHTGPILDFQSDIASIVHREAAVASHLSAIVRAPVRARKGETVVAAINLWTGRAEWRRLLRHANSARTEEFFARYCRALMTGPVQFCSEWGMAFEPHVQNVYVAFRDGLACGIILRDLDATILDARRVRPVLRDAGLELAKDTWACMPGFETGGKRLVQAMMFGHLGEVMWILARQAGARLDKLDSIVEDTWSEMAAHAPSASARKAVNELRGWSNSVKATLHTRLHRSTTMEFVRE